MNTIKLDNNYFLSPKHHQTLQGSQSVKDITDENGKIRASHNTKPSMGATTTSTADTIPDQKKKLSEITKVGFIEKLKN